MKDRVIQIGLTLVLAIVMMAYISACTEKNRLEDMVVTAQREADSLAGEAAAERARADGWVAKFGEEVPELQQQLLDKDEALARLAQDYQASRIEVRTYATLAAEAQGQLESQGEVVEEEPGVEPGLDADFGGNFDDGFLSADWLVRMPQRLFSMDYMTRQQIELVTAETGDGRLLITARSDQPRSQVTVEDLFYDLPEPEIRRVGLKWYWVPISIGLGWLGGLASK